MASPAAESLATPNADDDATMEECELCGGAMPRLNLNYGFPHGCTVYFDGTCWACSDELLAFGGPEWQSRCIAVESMKKVKIA